jgi:hypothetical protein
MGRPIARLAVLKLQHRLFARRNSHDLELDLHHRRRTDIRLGRGDLSGLRLGVQDSTGVPCHDRQPRGRGVAGLLVVDSNRSSEGAGMTAKYGNRNVPKMIREWRALADLCRAEGTPAIQDALDKVEQHIDYAYRREVDARG